MTNPENPAHAPGTLVQPQRQWAGVVLSLTGRLSYPANDLVLKYLREGWFEHSELVLMARLLRPGDVFLDVGAHCGLYSALAAKRFGGDGTIVIVEPNPELHPFIRANVPVSAETISGAIEAGRTTLVNAAIYTDAAEQAFHVSSDTYSAYSSISTQDSSILLDEITVTTRTLTSLLPSPRGNGLTFIKLDTEGAELAILMQALPHMTAMSDVHLLIEFDENNLVRSGTTSVGLAGCITGAGMTLAFFDEDKNRLRPYEGAFPVWGHNFIATRDIDALNGRLAELTDPWLTMTEDYLGHGHAAQRLYEKSEQLNRLLEDSALLTHRIAREVAATERRTLPVAEPLRYGTTDGEQRPRERVETAIRALNEEFGRLQGALDWLRTTTARQDNTLIQTEYSRSALVETIYSAMRTLQRLHEKMHGPSADGSGEADARDQPEAVPDPPVMRDRLYDMLGRVEGDVDWFLQDHREARSTVETLKLEGTGLRQTVAAAQARTSEVLAALEAAQAGFEAERDRIKAQAAGELAKAVAEAEVSARIQAEAVATTRAETLAAAAIDHAQQEMDRYVQSVCGLLEKVASDLNGARADTVALLAAIRQHRLPFKTAKTPSPLLPQAEDELQRIKAALNAVDQRIREARALLPATAPTSTERDDQLRAAAADAKTKLRALKDLHDDLVRLKLLAGELRQSQWLRLGGAAGARATQLTQRLFAMSEEVCREASALVLPAAPAASGQGGGDTARETAS